MSSNQVETQIYKQSEQGLSLTSPTSLPNASGFLWNSSMLTHVNCQGYVTSQFMQPEPAKYSHGPNLEAKTFIQPEQPFYTEHPGRFVFVKNKDTGEVVSLPYAPLKSEVDRFSFDLTSAEIKWQFEVFGVLIEWKLTLTANQQVELWQLSVQNLKNKTVRLSLYPYFTVGYKSWMNQSADYNAALNAIIAKSVTPYQKVEDYFNNKNFKDNTVLISDTTPDSWTSCFSGHLSDLGSLTHRYKLS